MSERAPYSRVYWSIADDPKFATVYDSNDHLATWLRLLMLADGQWPASAPVPASAKKTSLRALSDAGLIDFVSGGRFRIHGLDAERGRRRDAARTGPRRDPNGTQTGPERVSRPGPKPRRDEPRRDEPSRDEPSRDEPTRDGLPNLDRAAFDALEARTGHVASQAGDKQLNEYDRLVGDHGLESVLLAFDTVSLGARMTARQLVWGAVKVLEPFPSKPVPAAPAPKPFVPRKLEPWEQELRSAIAAKNGGFDEGDAA